MGYRSGEGGVSGAGGFHPRALPEPDMSLSTHPAPTTYTSPRLGCRWTSAHRLLVQLLGLGPVDSTPGSTAPSLHVCYRRFDATTSRSAPVPRFGTLALAGSPLELLP